MAPKNGPVLIYDGHGRLKSIVRGRGACPKWQRARATKWVYAVKPARRRPRGTPACMGDIMSQNLSETEFVRKAVLCLQEGRQKPGIRHNNPDLVAAFATYFRVSETDALDRIHRLAKDGLVNARPSTSNKFTGFILYPEGYEPRGTGRGNGAALLQKMGLSLE